MTNTKKTTKRNHFETLQKLINAAADAGWDYDFDALDEFIEKEIASLDKKAADAKARAAKTKEAADEIKVRIMEVLSTEEFMTTGEIIKALDDETLSSQRVTARMTQLIDAHLAEKEEVKRVGADEKTRKLIGYRKMA